MKHPFGIRLAVKWCGFLLLGHAATASAVMNTPASWSVSPSGAYTYEMPFRLPPGIAGVQPKVSLEYSSQSGNGIAGMGWSLGGLSVIARCPVTMTIDGVRGGVNMDANDRLCMDGQRLMLQTGTYGAEGATYSTQMYNGARIVGAALTGTDHSRTFKVYTKAGELMEYIPFNTPANNVAIQFVLSRVTDAKGNYWQAHYQADIAQGEIYPKAICYTGNSRLNQAPRNCIEFGYGSETSRFGTPVQRTDKSLAYMAGFALRNNQRLSGVRTLINATATASGNTWTLSGTQVTEYKLGYNSIYSSNNKSLLETVQECADLNCLPSIEIETGASLPEAFSAPQLKIAAYGTESGGWSDSNQFPRYVIDINGDGLSDIVGFASQGVYVSLNSGNTFEAAQLWIGEYGTLSGGWSDLNQFPRHLVDVNGDGLPDIVGFASQGVYVSLNTGTSFGAPQLWISEYGTLSGGWSDSNSNRFPRHVIDMNSDGLPDVVGFASQGIYVSLNTGSAFGSPQLWIDQYGTQSGGWSDLSQFPRYIVDINNDGLPDVVGFASQGVYVSLNTGSSFGSPQFWIGEYGTQSGGWVDSNQFPRYLIDVNGDNLPDVVGFAGQGIYVSLNSGIAFEEPQLWIDEYGILTGGWSNSNQFPRYLMDINGDGLPDVVGFASQGIYASLNTGSAFDSPQLWIGEYGTQSGGWSDFNEFPRYLVDVNGDGLPDVVGFAKQGVYVSLNEGGAFMPNKAVVGINNGAFTINSNYRSIVNWSGYLPSTGINKATFPQNDIYPPMYVTSSVTLNAGNGNHFQSKYSYGGLKTELGNGRGFLGFAWMESQTVSSDGIAGPIGRSTYSQQWPCVGMLVQSQVRLPSGGLNSQLDNTLRVRTPGNASLQACGTTGLNNQIVIPFVSESISRQWEMNSSGQQGAEQPRSKTTTVLDANANPTQIQEQTLNADGSASGYSRTTTNTYDSNAERARQGRLIQSSVTHVKP